MPSPVPGALCRKLLGNYLMFSRRAD